MSDSPEVPTHAEWCTHLGAVHERPCNRTDPDRNDRHSAGCGFAVPLPGRPSQWLGAGQQAAPHSLTRTRRILISRRGPSRVHHAAQDRPIAPPRQTAWFGPESRDSARAIPRVHPGKMRPKSHLRGINTAKTKENGPISRKIPRNLWKLGVFPLTLATSKPHCNHRQGSS